MSLTIRLDESEVGLAMAQGELHMPEVLTWFSRECATELGDHIAAVERFAAANVANAEHMHRIHELMTRALVRVPRPNA